MHRQGIIYRDLKPDNVVLDRAGHIRLADFGLSKEGIDDFDDFAKSFCGSYAYLAPEMILKEGHTKIMDWYLLGVVLYELLEGIPPFYDNDKDVLIKNIMHEELVMPMHISKVAQDLIKKLLEKDPTKRIGYELGADEIKQHPWFNGIVWADVAEKKLKPFKPYLFKSKDEISNQVSKSK